MYLKFFKNDYRLYLCLSDSKGLEDLSIPVLTENPYSVPATLIAKNVGAIRNKLLTPAEEERLAMSLTANTALRLGKSAMEDLNGNDLLIEDERQRARTKLHELVLQITSTTDTQFKYAALSAFNFIAAATTTAWMGYRGDFPSAYALGALTVFSALSFGNMFGKLEGLSEAGNIAAEAARDYAAGNNEP